jgi:Glycosyl transferase family 2
MGDPLVSIITPVLNRVETMGVCLASVTRQTYRPIEHIVVDGGSTDGTLDLLREYRAPHLFHWVSEPDNGMYEAINKGIAISRGEVLAYLNSDDLYLPWSVEVAVRALQQPGIELVYGDLGILRGERNSKLKLSSQTGLQPSPLLVCGYDRPASGLLESKPDGTNRLVRHGYRPPVPAQRSRHQDSTELITSATVGRSSDLGGGVGHRADQSPRCPRD